MDTTGSHASQPERDTVESDPAYDFAEDTPVDEDWAEEDGEVTEGEFVDAEERVVPLDADEFREPEETD
jgi:hypothetical protein